MGAIYINTLIEYRNVFMVRILPRFIFPSQPSSQSSGIKPSYIRSPDDGHKAFATMGNNQELLAQGAAQRMPRLFLDHPLGTAFSQTPPPGGQVFGHLLLYPPKGTLLFATDFHGQFRDFDRMADVFASRRDRGEDVYLLFAGDLIHGFPSNRELRKHVQPDDSAKVLEFFHVLQEAYPGRVHSLLGNHEQAHLGSTVVYKWGYDNAAVFERVLGPDAINEMKAYFRTWPVAAIAPNGIMFTHGSPSINIEDDLDPLSDLIHAQLDVRTHFMSKLYGSHDPKNNYSVMDFLEALRLKRLQAATRFQIHQPSCVIHGHLIDRSGYNIDTPGCLCLSTSYGLEDKKKLYLEIDLAEQYFHASDMREGHELKRLY
jgi:hypothetical protein